MSVKLNKSSKVKPFTVDTKAADLSSLSAENAVLKAGLENTVSMVNYFGSAIETQAIKLEALKLPTKLTLGWIIMNRKKFFEFVELVIKVIKEVMAKIKEIRELQKTNSSQATATTDVNNEVVAS